MDEFALIRRYFAGLTATRDGVVLGIGDDAALLQPAPGCECVVTSDTLVGGRHFPAATPAYDIGWKALAVNLSDLAAMGAAPRAFTLALTLPEADESWLADFAAGLKALADRHRVALIGGDTTRGALSMTITALGEAPAGTAVRRSGARAGDRICVTGTLGDGAAGLALLRDGIEDRALLDRLNRPEPRIAAGLAMRGIARAAIDLSDGLAGDLQHVLVASGVGAEVSANALPASAALRRRVPDAASRFAYQVGGGDDYELCICVPPDRVDELGARADVALTPIGVVTAAPGLRFVDTHGANMVPSAPAYRHFS